MVGRPPKPRAGEGPDASQRVEAVERALGLLDAFNEQTPALSLTALARKAGLYPSTALRLCGSLERCGYLVRDEAGIYAPGPKLARLGRLHEQTRTLAATIRPVLRRLAETTGETASFSVRQGKHRLCQFRVNGSRPVRSHLDEGSLLPLDKGAAGHVLMAWTGGNSPRHRTVRTEGNCISRGERDVDSAAVAVPVFGSDDTFLGALGLSGPVTRFGEVEIAAMLDALRVEAKAITGA